MRPLPIIPLCGLLVACALARADVVINEIMDNSAGIPDVEYVELYNTGPAAVDLTGWHLFDDDPLHPPCALVGVLQPDAYLIVAGDLAAFTPTYGNIGNRGWMLFRRKFRSFLR